MLSRRSGRRTSRNNSMRSSSSRRDSERSSKRTTRRTGRHSCRSTASATTAAAAAQQQQAQQQAHSQKYPALGSLPWRIGDFGCMNHMHTAQPHRILSEAGHSCCNLSKLANCSHWASSRYIRTCLHKSQFHINSLYVHLLPQQSIDSCHVPLQSKHSAFTNFIMVR